ncbi:Ff.00g065820.m01.CDS01 [Fusarium sp. VM40]|nr:Ff.00g065820.m01.CDS01 [Fusarium sp. VM40]
MVLPKRNNRPFDMDDDMDKISDIAITTLMTKMRNGIAEVAKRTPIQVLQDTNN